MDVLRPLPTSYATSRDALHAVAVHLVARAREQATGRFGLRVTPGGFGTPEFGDELVRVRVSGGWLVRESGGVGVAASSAARIDGATLRELAAVARVDLDTDLDVGHDTPPLGDVEARLAIDDAAVGVLADWFSMTSRVLDAVVGGAGGGASPTLVQLWPEHFDAALDLDAAPDRRVNLGGSPGDGFHDEPYLYVGPWTDDRPGDPDFWNAPFGAVLGYQDLRRVDDPFGAAAGFFRRGVELLAG